MRIALLLLLLLSRGAFAAGTVSPTLNLEAVKIEVTWVESRADMIRLRREHGQPPLEDPVFRSRLTGFSILGKRDGEYVCLLFVQKPERVDDDRTTALGHEIAHCLLGDYHR